MDASLTTGYSSKVEIQLLVAGHRLNVARIRGDQLVLRDKIVLPPTDDAQIVLRVDGEETTTPIVLPMGIRSLDEVVVYSLANAAVPTS